MHCFLQNFLTDFPSRSAVGWQGEGALGEGGGGLGVGGGGPGEGRLLEAEITGSHCGGTVLLSDRRAWAVELGADEILGLMVLLTVAPARTRPCASSWEKDVIDAEPREDSKRRAGGCDAARPDALPESCARSSDVQAQCVWSVRGPGAGTESPRAAATPMVARV